MREYELTIIVHPDLDQDAFNEIIERTKSWIVDGGGEIANVDLWGKRQLAYPIRKQTEGQYVLMHINISPDLGSEIEHNLRLIEPVMRYLLIRK